MISKIIKPVAASKMYFEEESATDKILKTRREIYDKIAGKDKLNLRSNSGMI